MNTINKSLPRVVIAVLTWNQRDQVLACLESIQSSDYANYEVALIDQHSTDGTVAVVREQYPDASFVIHRENFGFGEGMNGGVRFAIEHQADYLLCLDNDARIQRDTVKLLVNAAIENDQIAMVFPGIYSAEGSLREGQTGSVSSAVWEEGRLMVPVKPKVGEGPVPADISSCGIALVSLKAIKTVGYLDPNYFFAFDEADWFYRISVAGFSGRYLPAARVMHGVGATIPAGSEMSDYYRLRNILYFFKKHSSGKQQVRAISNILFRASADMLTCLLKGDLRAAKTRASAIYHFFRGKKRNKVFGSMKVPLLMRVVRVLNKRPLQFWRALRARIHRWKGDPERIRVRIDWNIGDELMAMPVFEALKSEYPNCIVDAEVRFPALVEGNPYIDSVNGGNDFAPDRVINLHQDVRNRPRDKYLPEIAGVKTWGEPRIYLQDEELERAKQRWGLDNDKLRIALCPEVWWLARRWPREKWIDVMRHFEQSHDCQLLILGTNEKAFSLGVNLMRQTTLREAAAVLAQSHLFLGHDSGLLYMALAVNTPSIGLYGPLNPDLLYRERPGFIPIWSTVECRGCWPDYRMKIRDHCPKIVPDCMTEISVLEVLDAAESLIRDGVRR